MFLAVFFLPRVSRRWRPLLFAYPLVMMFTVLYCGEHYLIDVLAGWGYVLATFALVGVVERWWRPKIGITDPGRHRRRTRRVPGHHRRVVLTGSRSLSPVLARRSALPPRRDQTGRGVGGAAVGLGTPVEKVVEERPEVILCG
jgi:hypothetical protein